MPPFSWFAKYTIASYIQSPANPAATSIRAARTHGSTLLNSPNNTVYPSATKSTAHSEERERYGDGGNCEQRTQPVALERTPQQMRELHSGRPLGFPGRDDGITVGNALCNSSA